MAKKPSREIPTSLTFIMNDLSRKDMRVGQMFSNLFYFIRSKGKDPFYVENEEMVGLFLESLADSGYNPFRPGQ